MHGPLHWKWVREEAYYFRADRAGGYEAPDVNMRRKDGALNARSLTVDIAITGARHAYRIKKSPWWGFNAFVRHCRSLDLHYFDLLGPIAGLQFIA